MGKMNSSSSCPSHHNDVAARIIEGEAVIVLPAQGEVLVLNEVGSRIWELADGSRTVQDIVRVIVSEYEAGPEIAKRDIEELLTSLEAKQAISLDPDVGS